MLADVSCKGVIDLGMPGDWLFAAGGGVHVYVVTRSGPQENAPFPRQTTHELFAIHTAMAFSL